MERKELYSFTTGGVSPGTTLLLACVTAGLVACSGEEGPRGVAEELTGIQADNVVYEMSQTLTNAGVREAEVEADTAYFFRDSSAVHLRGLTMTLFDEAGRSRATVTANRGRLDSGSNSMVGRGDVVLTIPGQNREIRSPELHYSSPQDRIWSDSATVMRQDDEVQCGTAFRSDLEFQNVYVEEMRTVGCGG